MKYRGDISSEEYAAMEDGYEQGLAAQDTALGRVLALCDESERQWEWNAAHDPAECVVPVFDRQTVERIRAAAGVAP